jgi:DNA-binding response OmpR family regulator
MSLLNDILCKLAPKLEVCRTGAYSMTEKTQRAQLHDHAHRVRREPVILIAEDEKLVAWDIEQSLREHNYEKIFLATSMRGAREIVETLKDQLLLVILDLKLNDGDASMLIDEFTNKNIAVLVVTGYDGFSHAQVPVICKPFSTNALLQAVASLLTSRS